MKSNRERDSFGTVRALLGHYGGGGELDRGLRQRVVAPSGADALQLVTGGAEHCNALATAPRPGASELRAVVVGGGVLPVE